MVLLENLILSLLSEQFHFYKPLKVFQLLLYIIRVDEKHQHLTSVFNKLLLNEDIVQSIWRVGDIVSD